MISREALDAAIRAQFAAETAWRYTETGEEDIPAHIYKFVSLQRLHEIERATGAQVRMEGTGTYGTYVLDYGGCVFHAPRREAD